MNDGIATRNLSWKELVLKSWGKAYTAPEIGYEFTGRKFDDHIPTFATPVVVDLDQYAQDYAQDYS